MGLLLRPAGGLGTAVMVPIRIPGLGPSPVRSDPLGKPSEERPPAEVRASTRHSELGERLFLTRGRPCRACPACCSSVCPPPHRLPGQCDGRPGPAALPHPAARRDPAEGQARGLQAGQQSPAPAPGHHRGHHAECGLLTHTPARGRSGLWPGHGTSPEWICPHTAWDWAELVSNRFSFVVKKENQKRKAL